jgi:hypothetical protein
MATSDWDWQCRMHISSCYLYDEGMPILSDADFDAHCKMLENAYAELPAWFTTRVSREALSASTALGLTYSPDDIQAATDWIHLVHDWYEYYFLPVPSHIPPRPPYPTPHRLL